MTTNKRPLTLEDFWTLQTVNDPRLSPDGRTVAYVVGTYDEQRDAAHSAIWLTSVEGGHPRQFTAGESMDMQPRWSPDGQRLAFVSTRHEGKPQIFIIEARGGEPRRLTNGEHGAHSPVWSPDGRRLCFALDVPSDRQKVARETAWLEAHPKASADGPRLRRQAALGSRFDGRGYIENRTHLFIVDAVEPDADPRQLTDGDYDDGDAAWSPDGALIAFISNRAAEPDYTMCADIWTVDVESGAPFRLTGGNLMPSSPAWSPDGQAIAFYAGPDPKPHGFHDTHLWMVSRQGGDQRDLSAPLDRPMRFVQPDYMLPSGAPLTWSPDGTTIYFLAIDHGDNRIFALDLADAAIQRLSPERANITSVQVSEDGRALVCLASTPELPFDVFALPTGGGSLRPLAETNRALLEAVYLAPFERVSATGPGGWEIEGWLVLPERVAQSEPCPLILHVHGGPNGAWGNTFYFQAQVLAGAGYASLYVNPRGSLGYGQAFSTLADWGADDYQDLLAVLDAVLARGSIDPRRLAITGISYGGFMTNWALGQSDRFAAGVSVNGVSNQVSMYGVSDVTALWFETEFGGPFWTSEEQWQRYRRHSPISYVGNVRAPLLLLQSENDYRCPIDQGEQMLTALRMRRQIAELIRFPGASHVIAVTAAPHHRLLQWQLTLDWFDTHVKCPSGS